ncbi:hypothetical protein BCR33DRAFT_716557 [Rhizoclosmatium globosum]|uniref:Uncharacterized protein n=1 Tax=Rhizoclosmatium globosum TaxID=329046 RepID=A0A1Y2CDX6_9FUNG|nr:hypothetical protein BCR33DRAFT_716557 [Rhizoclosmatium globosum]|eukprot:ORY45270.1 hypothetical protein BCR33DRAFT_716557 [Rhizoclosmatium globosum]
MIDVNPNLASTILAFLGVLTFVILVGLSCCLFYYCSDGNYSAVFKGPKNRLLLLLIASSIGYFVSAAIYTRHEADLDSPLLAKSCLFALTLILYLAYTWLRTNDIFRTHSTPHILTFFKTLTITTCIVCLLPPSILLLPQPNATKNLAYNITAATNIFFASLLDGYFAYACLQQIFETSKECNTNERGALYHPLIARYGFLSSISTLGSSLCYAGYAIMGGLVPNSFSIDSRPTFTRRNTRKQTNSPTE